MIWSALARRSVRLLPGCGAVAETVVLSSRRTPKMNFMTERIFNFSAGPAVIPVPVLEEAQRDMLSLPGRRHVGDGNQPSLENF